MTNPTQAEFGALKGQSTPGPWTTSDLDNSPRITSIHAPAAPSKVTEVAEHALWHKAVGIATSRAMARLIVGLHEHMPALLDRSITPEAWETIRELTKAALPTSPGALDSYALELAQIHDGDVYGAYRVTAPVRVPGHPMKGRTAVDVRFADGQDAAANAALIEFMLRKVEGSLASTLGAVVAVREIAKTVVVIDASYAREFDDHSWKVTDDDADIIERKTGARLGDMIAGLDGFWSTAKRQVGDGYMVAKGALDYRRHKLMVHSRVQRVFVEVPPETIDRLIAAATAFDGDVGRAVASRFA